VIFQDGGGRHFAFSKNNHRSAVGGQYATVTVPNLIKIGQTVAEI